MAKEEKGKKGKEESMTRRKGEQRKWGKEAKRKRKRVSKKHPQGAEFALVGLLSETCMWSC